MWTEVGKRISHLRKERNLTRAQFGKMIGVSGQYIGKIERGIHNISGSTIVKICNTTGVSSDYLLFGRTDSILVESSLDGLSREQISIGLDLLKRLAQFINTDNGNNALIQEVLRQQKNSTD